MKNVLILLFATLLLTAPACDKDNCPCSKKITVSLTASSNLDLSPVQCLPSELGEVFLSGGGWLSGETNETGTLVQENSTFTVTSCAFGPGENQIVEKVSGRMAAANGDYINILGEFTVTLGPNGPVSFEGGVTFNGGTGKFDSVTGSADIDPGSSVFDPNNGSLSWTGQGTIIYP